MRQLVIILACVFILVLSAHAEDSIIEEQKDLYGFHEVADEAGIASNENFSDSLKMVLSNSFRNIKDIFSRGLRSILIILIISALCGMVESVFDKTPPIYLTSTASLAVMCASVGTVTSLFQIGSSAIEEINVFSKTLMPALMTAGAASGAPLGATAQYSATVLFSDILITVISKVFFPIVYAYLAAATADSAVGMGSIGKIADFMKWIVSGGLKLILTLFVGYITATGLIATSSDAVGVKTAQFAISGTVPVVGGILADASETVIAGAMVVKNSIGAVGLLGVLAIVLTPVLTLGINYFLYKAAAALSAPMCNLNLSDLMDRIGSGIGVVFGMVCACMILLFISIVSSLYVLGVA